MSTRTGRTTSRSVGARSVTARSTRAADAYSTTTTSGRTDGLTNARTRIVGTRQGPLADFVIAVVRVSGAALVSLHRVTRRATAVVTPVGWAVLLATPLAFVFGYGLGWTELVVTGWALSGVLVLAALYLIGRTTLSVELRLVSHRVVVGEGAGGSLVVRNSRRRRVFGSTVEVPIGQGLAEFPLPSLARESQLEREFILPTERRGIVTVGPARTVRADPIGLVRRELVWTDTTSLVVHPRTIAIPSTTTGFVRDLEGNATRDLTSSDIAFHALREYQPGDERRNIHWKSTAKTGRYMVRQFEETRRSHLVIALSLARTDYATDDEFELAVSAAGSLGARAIADTRDVTVVVSEATPEFAKRKVFAVRPLSTLTRARLLDDLAVVQSADTALRIEDVAHVTADLVTGVSVAFLVCGSGATVGQLRAASTQFSAGVEVVAIVCDPDTVPGLRRVAGLSVFTIGSLQDLQKSLARSAAV
ncbi:DUF58 domain-containing protein [Glaciihabitans sp. dw_435]|uniref:DUF58 domain-containing protein n=1 Tax=Glaciihabitans sp. dw_435 TaxID=2720081 RepID=UPI0027DCF51B|nr:DUF58 domain-containing protein [Glaciihabitans sp. dw_435]